MGKEDSPIIDPITISSELVDAIQMDCPMNASNGCCSSDGSAPASLVSVSCPRNYAEEGHSNHSSPLGIARTSVQDTVPSQRSTAARAPCRITKFYDRQIRRSGYYEQLRRIVQPSMEEIASPGEWDTSGEFVNTVLTGFQHKYRQTGLVLMTDRCFCYCRFCFRKRFVGVKSDEIAVDYPAIAAYIRQHPEMTNVLLTGGDPFILKTATLESIVDQLLPIPHLGSIRFGTKATVFYPKRFADPKLGTLFEKIINAGKTVAVITHIDHLGEISTATEMCVRKLRKLGVQLFNQTVFLNRVNDTPDILTRTFRKLHQMGIRPYYLFQARPVRQGSHFQVPFDRGLQIVREVYRQLNGIEKTFRYVMSHASGKIEILDLMPDGRLFLRYHQCVDPGKVGMLFSRTFQKGACWLDELGE